ncbi:hypothetical protein ACUNV4_13990 [Granulosicoccus sp. 3-233]|uniref:hypothetical protein n=1 Tax=Granulosicoccus sp. 3-233 TaxID=3417969 RepID=UPI003D338CC1
MKIYRTGASRCQALLPLLAVFAGAASAADPVVDGNIISWDDGARYEVRQLLTGELVCTGDDICQVSEGHYQVTRYEDETSSTSQLTVGNPAELILDESNFEYSLQVSGRTIRWTEDGWHQVQDARTYEQICNGTDSCTVPELGDYIVINHDLGLRATLEVSDDPGPRVSGNTITWPNDGWYQVRDEYTGAIVCEGVDACSFADGSYLVSRLFLEGGTTWRVVLGDSTELPIEPVVSGNLIELPDDGWYDVQRVLTGETVCQSGEECTVEDGRYRVSGVTDGVSTSWDVVVGEPVEPVIDQDGFLRALLVSDRTISWFADGWYQVQDANTYAQICGGGDACTVPEAGEYIVINHTLGLRAELEISDRSGPVVNNNTISWPRDGWYQVKSEDSGRVLCEGVDACSFPDGSYLVSRLYHGGGTTWRVELGGDPEPVSAPTVVANTISWPDDGWYQVENRVTGEIVCQGGRSCTVPDGIYWTIRFHDGGSSAWRLIVGSPAELTLDQSGFADSLSVSGQLISWTIGGWYQVQDAHTFEQICNGTDSCTVPGAGRYIVINHSLGLRLELEVGEGA